MNEPAFVAAVIFGVLFAELRLSSGNERVLRQAGAVRPSGDPYLALALTYPLAFLAMAAEGVWRASAAQVVDAGRPAWAVSGVLLFVASKALKYWAIRSLGPRWTVRVWMLPGSRRVATGPYRYVAHPNYVAVIGELVGAAMILGARISGPVTITLVAVALVARIRFEERMLASNEPRAAETRRTEYQDGTHDHA